MKYLATLLILVSCAIQGPARIPKMPKVSVVSDAVNDTVALVNDALAIYCAGVVVDSLVITAAHCVDRDENVLVGERGITNLPVQIAWYKRIYFDEEQDLAILEPASGELRKGRLLGQFPPVDGATVVAVGHPLGLSWSVTAGIVSRQERWGALTPQAHWFQISPGIAPGNSGGPVYNSYGEVVGIASFMMRGYPHLGGAVHLEELKKAMSKVSSARSRNE